MRSAHALMYQQRNRISATAGARVTSRVRGRIRMQPERGQWARARKRRRGSVGEWFDSDADGDDVLSPIGIGDEPVARTTRSHPVLHSHPPGEPNVGYETAPGNSGSQHDIKPLTGPHGCGIDVFRPRVVASAEKQQSAASTRAASARATEWPQSTLPLPLMMPHASTSSRTSRRAWFG